MCRWLRSVLPLFALSMAAGLVFGCGDDSGTGDPVCGNGVVEADEQCDGEDLGGQECTDLSAVFAGGTLACTASCTVDVSGCDLVAADPVMAGVARVRMPVPLGIGTVGYAGFNVESEPSPFADIYAATDKIHGHPEFKAVVISRGPGYEVVFLRSDTVGIFQQFRRAVALEVEARLGRPIDDALLFGGTHTHSGPGRVVDGGGMYDIIADAFFPEFYLNMVDAAASAVMLAFDDLAPARVGHVWAANSDAHEDRRCDDGLDYTNDAIPVIAVEREGQIHGLVFAYAVHGTALGADDLNLSKDVSGGIEEYVEAGFDHPVVALFFNSWGADMRPTHPTTVPTQPAAPLPGAYEQHDRVGRSVADSIHAVLPGVTWEDDPLVFSEVHRVKIDREAIGYAEDEFPYEWGGVYCSGSETIDCDPDTNDYPWYDDACLPFPEQFPAPNQTVLSAGQIGSLYLVTFPGEPGTLLAEELLRRLTENLGYDNVAFFGYTQDYIGYSILEDDWWQGGYEAGGSIWGPRQGEYLVDMAEATFDRTLGNGPYKTIDASAPAPITPFDVTPDRFDPYVPTPPVDVGTITQDATAMYDATGLVEITVLGTDPWLGAPVATLVDGAGDPVLAPNGVPITSDGYAFWLQLVVDPLYSEDLTPPSRSFYWTFSMPIRQPVPGLLPDLAGGTYRLRVTIPTETDPVEVDSATFSVQ